MVHRGFGEDAVAQVEDVAGTRSGAAEELVDTDLEFRHGSEEHHRVEITLDGCAVTNIHPGLIDVEAPVDAHDVAAGRVQFAEVAGRSSAEVNYGDAVGADTF